MTVDTLDRHDSRAVFWFCRFAEPVTRPSEPAEPTTNIDQTDIELAEAYDVIAGLELGDADELTYQGGR